MFPEGRPLAGEERSRCILLLRCRLEVFEKHRDAQYFGAKVEPGNPEDDTGMMVVKLSGVTYDCNHPIVGIST
jgi:hypothetical protein